MKKYILALLALWCSSNSLASANTETESAGSVVFAIGSVIATAKDGSQRTLSKRDSIFSGDTITTSARSQAQLRMVDNAFVSIKPETTFRIEDYRQSATKKEDNVSQFELLKGGFRAITGQIGKRNQAGYQLKTPVATMGIRGTDYVVALCQDDCAHIDDKAKSAASAANGLYVGVIDGGVRVLNKLGSLNILPNQFGFIGGANELPRMLDRAPSFLMFDRTVMSQKDVRDLKRSISSRIFALNSRKNEGDGRERAGDNDRSVGGEEPSGRTQSSANASTSPSLPGLSAVPKAGGFANALDLDKLDSSLSDLVDSEKFQDMANSTFNTELSKQLNSPDLPGGLNLPIQDIGFGGGWGPSTGIDPNTNPWLPGYNTVTQPPAPIPFRYMVFASEFNQPYKTWAGLIHDPDYALSVDGAPTRYVQVTNATSTEFLLQPSTLQNPTVQDLALKDLGYDAQTQLSWGRWDGGSVDIKTLTTTTNSPLDSNGMHWVMGPVMQTEITLPTTGAANYQLIGNTNPTDNLGNVGVLGSASLNVNFTTQSVDANLQLGINNQTWTASGQNISIQSPTFSTSSLIVDVSNGGSALATGTGTLTGSFMKQANPGEIPQGAGIVYQLNATPQNTATTVNGAAAFSVKP